MKNIKEKIEVYVISSTKERLRAKADSMGITMSELIKRMLEEYLK